MFAAFFIWRYLAMTPLTTFANPLLGLEILLYLQLSRGFGLWHHYSLLKIAEVALNRRGIVRIWPREHRRHPKSMDLLDRLILGIVSCVIHEDPSVHSLGRALPVK